jgi:hypothetical protein
MKKSIIASLFAGLFAISAMAGQGNHMMKIEVNKEAGSSTVVNVETDGYAQVFEFSEAEMADPELVAERLSGLDETVQKAVANALSGIYFAHSNTIVIDSDIDVDVEGEDQVVVIKHVDVQGERNVVIDSNNLHNVIKQKVSQHFIFDSGEGVEIHHDSAHAAKMIQKLLERADLTADEIDQIQQSLDAKR